MVTAGDVIEFLCEIRELEGDMVGDPADADRELSDLKPDELARGGDLAWLSPKQLLKDPGRLAAFRGTLLLCPRGGEAGVAPPAGTVLAPCATPKLAFTRAVNRFFPEKLHVAWPRQGQPPAHPTALVGKDTALAHGVVLGPGVRIGAGCTIGPNTVIAHAEIGDQVAIGANCSIGLSGFGYERDADGRWWRFPHVGRVRVEDGVEIGSNTCVDRGALGETVIGRGAKIDNLVHVAHNVTIGADAVVIANAMLGGSAVIEAGAWVAPSAALMNQITIGAGAVVGLGAVVVKPVAPGATVVGNPARPLERKAAP